MFTAIKTPGPFLAAMQELLVGLQTNNLTGLTQFGVGGQSISLVDLQKEFEGYIGAYKESETTTQAHLVALQTRDAVAATAAARYSATVAMIRSTLGKKSPHLTDFGLSPQKSPSEPTVEEKQARIARAKATRAARGTLGKKQKAAITGDHPRATASSAAATAPAAKSG